MSIDQTNASIGKPSHHAVPVTENADAGQVHPTVLKEKAIEALAQRLGRFVAERIAKDFKSRGDPAVETKPSPKY